MAMRVFVENNYTKKRNQFAAKIYPTLCYGDLDAELDFSSCEISFCSPAGQPHHSAIPHRRLPLLHTHAVFSAPWAPLHLQHQASCYMLLSTPVVDWEKTVSSMCHFIGSALVQTWKHGSLSHSWEALQSDPLWLAEILHIFMNAHLVDLQMSNTTPQKGLFNFSKRNQSCLDERVSHSESQMIFNQVESEYADCEFVLLAFKCDLFNTQSEEAGPLLSCG